MRSRKFSHIVIFILVFTGIIVTISYSFQTNKMIQKIPAQENKVWLLGKGPYFLDTLEFQYSHLVTDFPLLELHPRSSTLVEIEGYENSKRFLSIRHRQDTLFVMQSFPESDTILVAVEGDYPIVVRAGAQNLRSITVNNGGRIDIPVNPYGSNPGNEIVYKPQDWEKYVMRSDSLELNLNHNARAELFLEIEKLSINIFNNRTSLSPRFNCTSLIGQVGLLELVHPNGNVCISGNYLEADQVIVKSNPEKGSFDGGFIEVHCSEELDVELLHRMNVAYTGRPQIQKKEKSFGRVINRNMF